jgi:hypothetical protein
MQCSACVDTVTIQWHTWPINTVKQYPLPRSNSQHAETTDAMVSYLDYRVYVMKNAVIADFHLLQLLTDSKWHACHVSGCLALHGDAFHKVLISMLRITV